MLLFDIGSHIHIFVTVLTLSSRLASGRPSFALSPSSAVSPCLWSRLSYRRSRRRWLGPPLSRRPSLPMSLLSTRTSFKTETSLPTSLHQSLSTTSFLKALSPKRTETTKPSSKVRTNTRVATNFPELRSQRRVRAVKRIHTQLRAHRETFNCLNKCRSWSTFLVEVPECPWRTSNCHAMSMSVRRNQLISKLV